MIHTRVGRIDGEDAESSEVASSFGGSMMSDLPPTTSATLDLDLYIRLCGGRRGSLHAAIALAQSRGELTTRHQASQENNCEGDMYSVVGRMALAQHHARLEQVAQDGHVPSSVGAASRSSSASQDGRCAEAGEVRKKRVLGFILCGRSTSQEVVMHYCSYVYDSLLKAMRALVGAYPLHCREVCFCSIFFRPRIDAGSRHVGS